MQKTTKKFVVSSGIELNSHLRVSRPLDLIIIEFLSVYSIFYVMVSVSCGNYRMVLCVIGL